MISFLAKFALTRSPADEGNSDTCDEQAGTVQCEDCGNMQQVKEKNVGATRMRGDVGRRGTVRWWHG